MRLPYDGIRVAGTLWSLSSHQVKDFLTRHQIPYQWLDIEEDKAALELVDAALKAQGFTAGKRKLPVVFFTDGSVLIVGGGPAGAAAAVYAARKGIRTGIVAERLGGQTLDDSLRLAAACGALSLRGAGGTGWQPTLDEAKRTAALTVRAG